MISRASELIGAFREFCRLKDLKEPSVLDLRELLHGEGFSEAEIAQVLGVTPRQPVPGGLAFYS